MGLRLFSSCSDEVHQDTRSGCFCNWNEYAPRTSSRSKAKLVGNPDPSNFQILKKKVVGHFIVLMVKYPECFNHEGKKVLVFEDISIDEIESLTSIDPHFCDATSHPSPIARFVPTTRGWRYATLFCKNIQSETLN